jgi:hypothetical protein
MIAQPSNRNPQRVIELHIEHLVLDGLPIHRSQSGIIQAAVETALTEMLASGNLAGLSSRAEYSVRADSLHLTPGVSPRGLGHQIGSALYGVLSQSEQQPTAKKQAAP